MSACILWYRRDLRLSDHPALTAALKLSIPVIPLFIWDPQSEGEWAPGGASRWWLHHSLQSLSQDLKSKLGLNLVIRKGDSLQVLKEVTQETKTTHVFWSRAYAPAIIARDQKIKEALKKVGLVVESFNSHLLIEPWEVQNQSEKPFQVFTPFWKAALLKKSSFRDPLPIPRTSPSGNIASSLKNDALDLLPKIPWDIEMRKTWQPGEAGALSRAKSFAKAGLHRYHSERDRPDIDGTSILSPHLAFGEVSPHQLLKLASSSEAPDKESEHFVRELGWREFAYHLLFHFPHTTNAPLREAFLKFPWRKSPKQLRAWQMGLTGYPIIDAGMRQLWKLGWMHNRVRMIVASFLTKDLVMSWKSGADWFWDTLVDADLASNTLGWQWAGGCGADAAPYFRIFNPILQGEKFDPDGLYVKKWVPELSKVPPKFIHKPWTMSPLELSSCSVVLGKNYPQPLVDHSVARDLALKAFQKVSGKGER